MFQSSSSSSTSRCRDAKDGIAHSALFSKLQFVRQVDRVIPVSHALGLLGAGLLTYGVGCSLLWFISCSPNILIVLAGMACLLGSALASHRGLVRFMPLFLEEKLFLRTPLDLMTQSSQVTGIIRRWVRVFLLCQEVKQERSEKALFSEEEIQTIVQGLDPDFLNKVFRRSSFEMLPRGVRGLLLPEEEIDNHTHRLERSRQWAAGRAGVGSLMARCAGALPPRRKQSLDETEVLSPAGIRKLLMEKKEAKQRLPEDGSPSLTPILKSVVLKSKIPEVVVDKMLGHASQQAVQIATVGAGMAAVFWSSFGLLICTPKVRNTLTGFFHVDTQNRVAVIGTTLSVLGAGISSMWAFYGYHHWMGAERVSATSPKAAVEAAVSSAIACRKARSRMSEPDEEVSPENSSAEDLCS